MTFRLLTGTIVVTALQLAAWSVPAQADIVPYSALPAITGTAASPVNIPITRSNMQPTQNPDGTWTPAQAQTFNVAITGKDMDTWNDSLAGTNKEIFDPGLACRKSAEEYLTMSGPALRGFASDGTATWDLVGRGVLVSEGTPPGNSDSRTYINVYELYNSTQSGRSTILNDDRSWVRQTLVQPAF